MLPFIVDRTNNDFMSYRLSIINCRHMSLNNRSCSANTEPGLRTPLRHLEALSDNASDGFFNCGVVLLRRSFQ